jgi:xylulose-5-phosphate/fructose-6-phosphate phosphoketolase
VRVVNVVDLMTLQSPDEHPHGLSDRAFDGLFTQDKPVIFAYHGYPQLIHRLTYKRANNAGLHVHGYREEGTTTTPFDMVVLTKLDRFHLALDAIRRVPGLAKRASDVAVLFHRRLDEHHRHIRATGEDMPEILDWGWSYDPAARVDE